MEGSAFIHLEMTTYCLVPNQTKDTGSSDRADASVNGDHIPRI